MAAAREKGEWRAGGLVVAALGAGEGAGWGEGSGEGGAALAALLRGAPAASRKSEARRAEGSPQPAPSSAALLLLQSS